MNELSNTNPSGLTRLDTLAQEARAYSEAFVMNAFQLGRIFTEAKQYLKHGEWLDWVRENTGMSETYVRDSMRVYQKFGDKPSMLTLDKSKLFKLLALPEGKVDDFMDEHDVASMSVREVGEAVKQARAEEQAKTQEAVKRARQEARAEAEAEAEGRIQEAERRVAEAEEKAGDTQHFIELARKAAADRAAMEREKKSIEMELERQQKQFDADMQDQQNAYDQLNQDYLNLKSLQKRGDADRTPGDELSIGVFTSAVREFIGLCACMPYMGRAFDAMDQDEKERFNEQLSAIEGWATGARRALNTLIVEGGVIDG